jgi:hypothetical protein
MRLDIPDDLPRRRREDVNAGANDEHTVIRKLPDNPILHRLKSLVDRAVDYRWTRPPQKPKSTEQTNDITNERRRPLPASDPRRPARTISPDAGPQLRPEERQILREAGRFRVVRASDLRETLYNGKARPLENDLRYLRDKGLVETAHINLRRDGRRRTIERVEVVTLTKEGRRLLLGEGDLPRDQRLYAGLVKPREAEHDSQIYRAYRKEAERIEKNGGRNLRVKLDFELKAEVQKAIYQARKADAKRDMAEIKQEVAGKFELPFVDGKIQIPDTRIEYDLPWEPEQDVDQGSRTGHQDIEILTAAYRPGHLRAKAQAGFRAYASPSDHATLTAQIERDHPLMEKILEL